MTNPLEAAHTSRPEGLAQSNGPQMSRPEDIAALRQAIYARRQLAIDTIHDMRRLHEAWKNNSLTAIETSISGRTEQKLTVTLNEEQIDAVVSEFMRCLSQMQRLEAVARDYEIEHLDARLFRGVAQADEPRPTMPPPPLTSRR